MPTLHGYDDAWLTPGWTAQNFAYPPDNQPLSGFPLDVETVTISGHFLAGDGGPANGWFEIDNANVILAHATDKVHIMPIKIRVEIKDGTFSCVVPATDATTLTSNVSGWGYHVRVALSGRLYAEAAGIHLPRATANVDVYDILTPGTDVDGQLFDPVLDGGTP